MTFTVTIPSLAGSPSLTALTLVASETALAIGTQKVGVIAQVSGNGAAGFNVFTPTTNATYYLVIRGQDVATGAPAAAFLDVVELTAVTGWAPTAVSSTNTVGTPGARTYANATGAFKITIAGASTYYIDLAIIRFPA